MTAAKGSIRENDCIKKIAALILLLCLSARGEVPPPPPTGTVEENINGQTVVAPTVSSNGMAAAETQNHLYNPATIVENEEENATNGLEYKYNDADRAAQEGANAAIGAGVGLTTTGALWLASPDIATKVAGAILLAEGAMEFAQAGASESMANQNGSNNNLLTETVEPTQTQSATSTATQALSQNEELSSLLASSGVNSTEFINSLASGSLQSPEAVLAALGTTGSISPEDLAKAEEMAAAGTSAAIGSSPESGGGSEPLRVITDDQPAGGQQGQGGASVGDSGTPKPGSGSGAGKGGVDSTAVASALNAIRNGQPITAQQEQALRAALASGMLTAEDADRVSKLLGLKGEGPVLAKKANALDLMKLGVITLRKHQNIFQLASRNYRSFKQWRATRRLALNP